MSTAKNDITGNYIRTKSANQKYLDNFDRIFRNKDENTTNTTTNTTPDELGEGEKQNFENCGC